MARDQPSSRQAPSPDATPSSYRPTPSGTRSPFTARMAPFYSVPKTNYLLDDDMRGAAAINLAGQVRLGAARCTACQDGLIFRETIVGPVRHTAPIPCCTTTENFAYGICAPCYAAGGTMKERFARCSVSRRLTYKEFSQLTRQVE